MRKCQYKYKYLPDKECPHEALEEKEICYWHEDRLNKWPIKELRRYDFFAIDLAEANLKKAMLHGANLEGANLYGARLQGAILSLANFEGANLNGARLQGANLSGARLQGANLSGARLQKAILYEANLQEADLSGTNLHEADLSRAKFDNSSLKDAKYDKIIINEKKGDREQDNKKKLYKYQEAFEIYRILKNYFRNEGRYEESGVYYYREKVMKGKIYSHTNKKKYFGNLMWKMLCGYGEKPGRIISLSIALIISFSFFYFIFGIENETTKIIMASQSCILQNACNYLNCLYFSIVTFTALGYGDLYPTGITKIFAASEAFIGAFMIGLFIFTLGRKIMR